MGATMNCNEAAPITIALASPSVRKLVAPYLSANEAGREEADRKVPA